MTDYNWPEITNDTPLSEIKEIHRRIWDYVIENGEKPDTPYINNCVLCEYSSTHYNGHDIRPCSECPAKWPGKLARCYVPGSDYNRWLDESDPEKNRLLAKKIRNIEFKEEIRMNGITPRYPHILSIDKKLKPIIEKIINDNTPNPCDVKCLGRDMWQLLFYASEEEYDKIVEGIEKIDLY